MAALAVPVACGALSLAQWGCCLASATGQICCSFASCFGCKYNARLARLVYLFIFMLGAVLAVILRYYGESAFSGVAAFSDVCKTGQCYGAQAAYRVSFSLTVVFAFMAALTAVAPVTHLAGWLVKLLLFALVLGLSVLINNEAMLQFAMAARVFSVVFLLLQVIIIIELSYKVNAWLTARIAARDAELDAAGWQPGVCSNAWRVLLALSCLGMYAAAGTGLVLLFTFFGSCELNNFFTAQTLVVGVAQTIASLFLSDRGVLPPAIILAYNTYITYSAITNNPDPKCNALARSENQSQASIIAGLIIAILSVTWVAVSSAGGAYDAVSVHENATPNPAHAASRKGSETDAVAPLPGTAASYDAMETGEAKGGDPKVVTASAAATATASEPTAAAEAGGQMESARPLEKDLEPRPWVFHVVMAIASMYLAMMATNWGDPNATKDISGSPELSVASMWARMGSIFTIHVLFTWAIVAPRVCPGRDFS
jgi:hypothetical protein